MEKINEAGAAPLAPVLSEEHLAALEKLRPLHPASVTGYIDATAAAVPVLIAEVRRLREALRSAAEQLRAACQDDCSAEAERAEAVIGPCKMDGPGAEDGPVCHCGKPSEYEVGLCGPCGKALGWRPHAKWNATLIAAAPELYEALREARYWIVGACVLPSGKPKEALEAKIDAALTKAEDRPSSLGAAPGDSK